MNKSGPCREDFLFTIPETLAQAKACHGAGQLPEAEQLYRQILEVDSANAEAHYQLGIVLAQQRKLDEAISCFEQACRLKPDSLEMAQNLRRALAARDYLQGMAFSAQGNLSEAAACYRRVLQLQSDNVAAQGNLGHILRKQGMLEESAACYRRILELDPKCAEAHNDLGITSEQQSRLDEAIGHYRRAVELRPDFAYAHNNLGAVLAKQSQLAEAVACYRQALRYQPDFAEAHNNLGAALAEMNELGEAAACYRRALALKADYAEAHNNLGVVLAKQRKPAEAAACFRRLLALKPDHAEAHNRLGRALMEENQLVEAKACFRRALSLKPDYAEAHNNLGFALSKQDNLDEAAACYRQALKLQPDYVGPQYNLAIILTKQNKPDEAMLWYRRALALTPEHAEACDGLGIALMECNRVGEAVDSFRQALAFKPDYAGAHCNLALALLLAGRFAEGWPEYEWRRECKGSEAPVLSRPRWMGGSLDGKTILLHNMQGFGDALQFVRYAKLVQQQGGRVILACEAPLMRLLASCPGVDRVVDSGQPLEGFDVHVPLLSLPGIFGTTLDSIPARVPYLLPDAKLVEKWKHELSGEKALKIGIAWQGSQAYRKDRLRSIPLSQFAGIARTNGVSVFSLQMGAGHEQLIALDGQLPITDLKHRLGDFHNTAAIVRNLDLVITCDSAPAHLAGALGVPVWVALSFVPHWTWLLDREDSPWYPTARLFRQRRPGGWDGVFQRIQAALSQLV
jgi:tetratricopeptide (TPR) repeat protein